MKPLDSDDVKVDSESVSIEVKHVDLQDEDSLITTTTGRWVHGDPGPFGLLCFGMTTCMLMFIKTGWSEKELLPSVFCYALFYGGIGQFAAGILELIKGNAFGGAAFGSYGAFWMGVFLYEYLAATTVVAVAEETTTGFVVEISDSWMIQPAPVGMTLWCGLWAFLTLGFFVVTLRRNACLMTVFASLVITFGLLAGGVWSPKCEQAAGYVGFLCGCSAIYAAFAFLFQIELEVTLPGAQSIALI